MLQNKTIIIGVTGGIAAYKACDVVSKLRKLGASVHVMMTKAACKFVAPLTFQTLSNHFVISDMFAEPKTWEIEHISLAKKADLMVIVPATANVIGKIASGIADDMLTTTVMASRSPVMFAPAMNTGMYRNPIVQENIRKLKTLGYPFIEPVCGMLACGDEGEGKLADVDTIVESVEAFLAEQKQNPHSQMKETVFPKIIDQETLSSTSNAVPQDLTGKKILITELENGGLHPAADFLKRYPHQLSGGQLQRISIIRAMLLKPQFIIADEPVSMLDVSVRADIINMLLNLKKQYNATIVFISHDISLTRYISDKIAVMYLGRIVEYGDADDIIKNPKHPYTKVLISNCGSSDPTEKTEKIFIQGEPPTPIDPKDMCYFAPRCFMATDECFDSYPDTKKLYEGHIAACHKL